jgi:phosphomannomutase
MNPVINPNIFRSYDIRGIYGKDIDEEIFEKIGNSFAQTVDHDIAVTRDSRLHSPKLMNAFISGAAKAEKKVVDISELPSSCALHFSTNHAMELAHITASHLTKEWNGVKFFHINGHGYSEEDNFAVRDVTLSGKFFSGRRAEAVKEDLRHVKALYCKDVASKIASLNDMKILVDCGNGSAGIVAKDLFKACDFNADFLFEKPDGSFPNRLSDPNADPLTELRRRMKDYDMGIAYDGDVDRVVLVSKEGKLTPEQMSYVILSELLKTQDGPIVVNVECSRVIDEVAKKYSRPVYRVRVGYTFIMAAMKKYSAAYGIESSSHCFVPSIAQYSDVMAISMYAARVIQKSGKPLEKFVSEIPKYPMDRINLRCPDAKKFRVIEQLKKKLSAKYGNVNTIDGVRVDLDKGWILVRASNTEPVIRLTIEADDGKSVHELKEEFLPVVEREITG